MANQMSPMQQRELQEQLSQEQQKYQVQEVISKITETCFVRDATHASTRSRAACAPAPARSCTSMWVASGRVSDVACGRFFALSSHTDARDARCVIPCARVLCHARA